ncbi:hypothetical protein V5O48_000840 [Marasmius crinis-equi]|uniref:Uncharacterized protein n=1 Tax=Marasmius crinis-equi TaxID=585013 RepID=A0ABR3G0I0_9AGAR
MDLSPYTAKHSAHVADSISSLSKTVLSAFSEIEARYQDNIAQLAAESTQARNDTRDAQAERDNAIKRLHEAQLESQEWKHEIGTLKASRKQSEDTVAQQAETIVQLRKDLTWWKDQARNWQEHFLRVEEARCTLSSRLEEYKEKLNTRPTMNVAPLTPVSRYADSDESKDNPCSPPSSAGPSQPTRSVPHRKKTPMPKTKAIKQDEGSADKVVIKQRKSNPVDLANQVQRTEPPTIIHTRLIRRVHAVVPVKEESEEDEEPLETSPLSSPPPIQHPIVRGKSWRNAQKYLSQVAEEDELEDEGYADHDVGRQEEEEEEEPQEEEEDDELMITSKTRHDDKPYTPSASRRAVETPPPSKKRRRNNSHIRPSTKRRI